MSCDFCHLNNSRICQPSEHCGLCYAETIEEIEALAGQHPSERTMEQMARIIGEEE